MTTPTVPVTVEVTAQDGTPLEGVVVTAFLDRNEVYQGIVVARKTQGVSAANGKAVLNCFPNAPAPAGLGTTGSTYRFTAKIPNGRELNERARAPNNGPCRLEDIRVVGDGVGLNEAQIAVSQAQAAVVTATAKAAATAEDRIATGEDRDVVEGIAAQFGSLTEAIEATQQSAADAAADRVQTGLDVVAAQAAASESEIYAAAAKVDAGFHDTIAAGLTAAAEGETFGVKAGGSDGLTRPTVYRDDAGVATLLYAVLPASEYDTSAKRWNNNTTSLRGQAFDSHGNASFTPLAPYFGGVQGDVWVCDLSKMWQDSAMTTPVTAAGQNIGAWESVTGNHVALQSTSGSRPTLQQDASGNYYVDFATSKWMVVSSIDLSDSNRLTLIAAINKVSSGTGILCELSTNVSSNNGAFFYQTRAGATTDRLAVKGSGSNILAAFVTGGEPQKFVVTAQINLAAPEHLTATKVRKNGVDTIPAGGVAPGDVNFGAAYPLYIGSRAGSSQYFNNHVYMLALIGGATPISTIKAMEHCAAGLSGLSVNASIAVPPVPPAATPNYHIVGMGQSLANGTLSTPLRNTSARYSNCYSFAGGVRPLDSTSDPGTAYESFIAMIERTAGSNSMTAYNATTVNETPMSGMCAAWNELIVARASTPAFAKLIGSVSGFGATSLFNLGRGKLPYDRAIEEIRYGRRLSEREHRPHIVPAVYWMQGVADTASTTTYTPGLVNLYADLCEDVKDASGQTFNPLLLCSQTAGHHSVAVQQLAAMGTAGIYVAFPEYFLTRVDGIGHLSGLGSELAGAYFSKALDEVLPVTLGGKGNTSWVPLSPLSFSYAGGDIDITFHGNVGNIALDTITVAAQTASGFVITDAGAANVPITSVTVTGANTIRLSTAATIAAGFTVKYATALAGGNVRDSDTATYTSAQDGVKNLYNWLVAFSEVLS